MSMHREFGDLMYYTQKVMAELRKLEGQGYAVQLILAALEGDQLLSAAMAFDKDLTGIIVAVNTEGKEVARMEFNPNEPS